SSFLAWQGPSNECEQEQRAGGHTDAEVPTLDARGLHDRGAGAVGDLRQRGRGCVGDCGAGTAELDPATEAEIEAAHRLDLLQQHAHDGSRREDTGSDEEALLEIS